ncbi:heterokaryon incompatibility protein-domain-containing protein [Echria macrotheca]|uniref:Heterokaryon incompatibility protein-domain-containing protein n=1 Tax=Echria macrotheca TaxID=438768 RepID=A0AAJ0F4G0_9PEZI|nr:heterokaryon incompatibility protein-domain-containing protein [Echria macrotheca]
MPENHGVTTVQFDSWTGKYLRVGTTEQDWNVYAVRASRLPWPDFPTKDVLVDFDPTSDASFTFLQSCLQNCLANHHETCRSNGGGNGAKGSTGWLPTRLLRFHKTGFRLIETEQVADKSSIRYVALSYCWGGDQKLKLTTAGLAALRRGMPLSILPPLFHDVLFLCRKLGVDHIWIDSLCIVQDSAADWQRECVLMPEVYRYAFVTLAAGSAASTNQSMLQRDVGAVPGFRKPQTVWLRDASGAPLGELLLVPHNRTTRHTSSGTWGPSPDPLATRAWTLQERLLASRVIYFGLGELEWTCGAVELCECTPEAIRGDGADTKWRYHSANALTSREHALRFWYVQVRNYSKRRLTYTTDKLPAVEGLARAVGPWLGGDGIKSYAAGLWLDDMARGLAWYCIPSEKTVYLTDCGAPSWSWASVGQSVGFNTIEWYDILVPFIRGCRMITDPTAAAASHTVLGGRHHGSHLSVEAPLMFARLLPGKGSYTGKVHIRLLVSGDEDGDEENGLKFNMDVDGMMEVSTDGVVRRSADAYDAAELASRLAAEPLVYAMPAVYHGQSGRDSIGRFTFVVLSRVSEKPEQFQRLGSFGILIERSGEAPLDPNAGLPKDSLPWSDEDYQTLVIV